MTNSLLTPAMITREAIRLFTNSNSFIQNIDRRYDDQFAKTGAKIGQTLNIRLPNDFTVRTGAAVSLNTTTEQQIALAVSTQKGVDLQFSTVERTMSLDDYSRRILGPAINNLVGAVAADVMTGAEGIPNFVSKTDGASNIISPDLSTFLTANATLDINSAPQGNRKIMLDPITEARTVASLSGLLNPASRISKQFEEGRMYDAVGFEWYMDQTIIKHTTGAYSTLGTVSGANQTGSTITTSALAGPLVAGDVITLAGSNAVNRVTKTTTGQLRRFVVTANVATNATSIPVYPALTPAVGGVAQPFQTVDVSPTNGGAITVVSKASEAYRKNFAYVPEAVTLVTADLEIPNGVHEAHRESFDDVSIRLITWYNGQTDQMITRLDVLYGYLWVRPEWACVIADVI